MCDHVMVLINGQLIAPKQLETLEDLDGFGYYRLKNSSLTLNKEAMSDVTLDLVVENMGRVNVGKIYVFNRTLKGLWQGDVTINGEALRNWTLTPLDMKKQWINELDGWQDWNQDLLVGPAMYSGVLTVEDNANDTFVDVKGWGKGMVFINGFALGRYAALGPQASLYLPAPLLVKGDNQIVFFEHFYAPDHGLIKFVDELLYKDVIKK